jgi:hypothetical protein
MGYMSPEMRSLAKSQDLNGWRNFTEGYISTHFYEIQSFHLTRSSSYLTSADWTNLFISKILQITHSQWIYRNISLHNKRHRYLHKKKSEEILKEVEALSDLAPEDVPAESRFLLEINYTNLATFHIETQKCWTLAVRAAIHAKTLEQAQSARSKRIRWKNNSKIPSRKKMGIVAIKQQIRQDGRHKNPCNKEPAREKDSNQSTLDKLIFKRPHPTSITTILTSNKRLRKPN